MSRQYQRAPARPSPSKREPILVVPLKHGGMDGGEPITEIRLFRRVNVGDLEASDEAKGQIGKIVILTSRLSGLSVKEVRELDAEDLGAVSAAIGELLGGATDDEGALDDEGGTFPG